MSSNSIGSGSFGRVAQLNEEKWWLPVPCVPPDGLSEESRMNLRHKRDCANQIHKAAMAINSNILAEMDIPEGYMASLPKVSELVFRVFAISLVLSSFFVLTAEVILCNSILVPKQFLSLADWQRKPWRHNLPLYMHTREILPRLPP